MLALLLLFAQHAELRCQYGHYVPKEAGCMKEPATDTCATRLTYAHVTGGVKACEEPAASLRRALPLRAGVHPQKC